MFNTNSKSLKKFKLNNFKLTTIIPLFNKKTIININNKIINIIVTT